LKFISFNKWIFSFITILFSTAVFAGLAPDELVRKTADDVISAIKSDKDIQGGDKKKIYQLAEEKILPSFDFERISRLVLGKAWRKATSQQKKQFKAEFRSLLLRTYSIALSKYKDQGIKIKPMRMKPADEIVTVKTEIVQDGAQPIKVNYALAKNGDSWLVFDIVIEGVSLVTNYRSQFSSEIRKGGMDSLNKKLANKNKSNKD
jgi:phospholipid transport system substrate-binding protein|tara:strand:- start:401 stop:1015 length:615 start_codon:yes stop_codon:yes gene_type:complete